MRTESRPVLSILVGSLGLSLLCAIWVVPVVATHPVVGYLQDWYRFAAAKLTIVVC